MCNASRLEHEVKFLAELAEHIDYFPYYSKVGINIPNVEIHNEKPVEVIGDGHVEGLKLSNGSISKVCGLFCIRTSVATANLMKELHSENGHISVDRSQQTNIKGCFAAGDCTGRPYQYAKAIGEGNTAAHSIIDHLAQEEQK